MKRDLVVLLTSLLILFSCTQDNIPGRNREAVLIPTPPKADVILKEKGWVRIFFGEINARLEGTGIDRLPEKTLLPGEREVRVWVGFDLYPLNGVILRENEGKWTAVYLPPIKDSSPLRPVMPLREPKSGWKKLWGDLEKLGLYTLPDSEDIGATNGYPDAKGAVIEIRTEESYRTYMYGGLGTPEAEESKKVVEICLTLSREFGVDLLDGPKRQVGIRDG